MSGTIRGKYEGESREWLVVRRTARARSRDFLRASEAAAELRRCGAGGARDRNARRVADDRHAVALLDRDGLGRGRRQLGGGLRRSARLLIDSEVLLARRWGNEQRVGRGLIGHRRLGDDVEMPRRLDLRLRKLLPEQPAIVARLAVPSPRK